MRKDHLGIIYTCAEYHNQSRSWKCKYALKNKYLNICIYRRGPKIGFGECATLRQVRLR